METTDQKVTGRKFAIFDIDGTIFRSSLLIDLVDAFIQENIFKAEVSDIYKEAYKKWTEREGLYEEYIDAVVSAFNQNLKGIKYEDFDRITKRVIVDNHNKVYQYTRDLVKELKKKNYYLLAISNSPKEIVDEFCKTLGFDKIYGRMYEVDIDGKFTGQGLYLDKISDKAIILKHVIEKEGLVMDDSIGVGDTESDISFLDIVKIPICFNPNKRLYDAAKSKGWKIIVERKDVIYEL